MDHGKRSTYTTHKCRCFSCKLANARYQRLREAKVRQGRWEGLRSPVKAKRMLRSLKAEGFTKRELMKRMGVTKLHIKRQIQASTERRIEWFYNYYVKEAA